MTLKIAVLGNCQGEFYQALFGYYSSRFKVIPTKMLFQQNDSYTETFHQIVDSCDFVVSRVFGKGLRFTPGLTTNLRERLGSKLIVFPNIYYNGYYPDFTVVYGPDGKGIKTLAGDYSSRTIYAAYRKGMSQKQAAAAIMSKAIQEKYKDAVSSSIEHLKSREDEADVAVSDLIVDGRGGFPNLYTYNHPNNWVMYRLFERILEKMGVDPIEVQGDPLSRFALNGIMLPVYPFLTAPNNLNPACGSYTWKRRLPPEERRDGVTHRDIGLEEIIADAYARYQEAGVPPA